MGLDETHRRVFVFIFEIFVLKRRAFWGERASEGVVPEEEATVTTADFVRLRFGGDASADG